MTSNRRVDPERQKAMERHVVPEINVIYRVALAMTRNPSDAEDLVQETLLRAFRAIDRFDGRHPRAWLLTILRNANINRLRKHRLEFPSPNGTDGTEQTQPEPADERGPEVVVVDEAFDSSVAEAFNALPRKYRDVVGLVDIDGLSYGECATALGIPLGTVMSRLHRARAKMKKRLVLEGAIGRRWTNENL
ncbi:MAG: sigma-70 family RNA polymerase sigma factor, partial [Acidimicrobiia bacterium]